MNISSRAPARSPASRFLAAAALLLVPVPSFAANIWDGGGADGKWSTLANWDNDALPAFSSGLTFGGAANLVPINDLTNLNVGGLTFDAGASAFTLQGNAITLAGGITDNAAAVETIAMPLVLAANTTANVTFGGAMVIGASGSGSISGAFGLTKSGFGSLTLGVANTYTGNTLIDGGTLRYTADNAAVKALTFGAVLNSTNTSTLELADADVTATGLTFQTNTSTPNLVTITAGHTLRVNGVMTVGSDVSGLNIGGVVTSATFTGGGTLFVNAGANHLSVAMPRTNADTGNDPKATLDLSALANFNYTATTGELRVGGGNAMGTMLLASTSNVISAAQIRIGDSGVQSPATGNNNGGTSAFSLGAGTNLLNANTIIVGAVKSPANFTFQSTISGSVSIAGLAGGTSRANITVGNASSGTAPTITSTMDLAGHTATVQANTVMLGQLANASGGGGQGRITFDTGTFDVNNLVLATHSAGTASGGASGTFILGGPVPNNTATGVLTVNTQFLLVNRTIAAGTQANGTFTINGGTANINSDILIVDASTAARNTTLTLAGGTLNMMGHAIATSALPVNNVNLPGIGQTATLANLGGTGINGNGLTFVSGGTLILEGTNTYTGTTTITGSTLQIGTGGDSGTLGVGPVMNEGTLVINRTGALSIPGGITGSGTIKKTGTTTLALTLAANSTAPVTIEQGVLGLTGGAGAVTVGSGTGLRTGFGSASGSLSATSLSVTGGNLLFDFDATSPLITISGTATFDGASTLTPNLSVPTGTYTLLTANLLTLTTTPSLVAPTGTRKSFATDYTTPNTIKLIVTGVSKALQWSGATSSSWEVGAGAPLNWRDGALNETFFQGDAVSFLDGATNRVVTIAAGATVTPASIVVNNSAPNPYTIGGTGAIGGTTTLVKNGDGALTLASPNTFSGGTTLNGGTLNIHHASALGTGPLVIAAGAMGNSSGAAVVVTTNNPQAWNGDFSFAGPDALDLGAGAVTLSADLIVTVAAGTLTVGGPIQGAFGLTKDGPGTLVLAGANGSSSVTIAAGALQVGSGGVSGSLGGAVVNNAGTLRFNRSDNHTVANAISGAGDLVQIGSAILTLAGTNNYTGTTVIGAGKIRVTNSSSLGFLSGNVFISQGAALDLGGSLTTQALNFGSKSFVIAGNGPDGAGAIMNSGVSQFNALQQVTLSADATVGGTARFDIRAVPTTSLAAKMDLAGHTLTKTGTNEFSLVGTDVTDGDIIVNQGLFSIETVTKVPDFGTGKKIVMNAGTTLRFFGNTDAVSAVLRPIVFNGAGIQMGNNNNANSVIGSPMTLNGDITVATLNNNAANTLTLTGAIGETGAHSITKNGVGTLVLTGTNSYSGGTFLNAGTLTLNSASAIGTGPLTIAGGTLANSSGAPVTLTTNNPQTWTSDFIFQGPDSLNLGTASVTMTANRAITVAAGDLAVGAINGGAFSLIKTGSGGLTVNGASTYTGGTTVNAGTLTVNGSLSGAMLANGGLLQGTGTIGTLDLVGAVLAPGPNAGVLQSADAVFDGGIYAVELNGATAGNGAGFYDQLKVIGAVTMNAPVALSLDFSNYDPVDGTDRFTIINNDASDAVIFGNASARFIYNGASLNDGDQFTATSGLNTQLFSISYTGGTGGNDVVLTAVPEPACAAVLLAGLGAIAAARPRRRRV